MKEFLIILGIGLVILIFLSKKLELFKPAIIYQLRNSLYRKHITYNIFFKSFTDEDVEKLVKFAKRNKDDLNLIPYLHFLEDPSKAEKFCESVIERAFGLSYLCFIIYNRKFFIFKKVIGIIYCDITIFRIGYISYWLDKDWRGKGIMTLTSRHLVKIAFEWLRLKELNIIIKKTNPKSIAIAERLGFKQCVSNFAGLLSHYAEIKKIGTKFYYKMSQEDYFNNFKNKN